jgi:hypothetical protein
VGRFKLTSCNRPNSQSRRPVCLVLSSSSHVARRRSHTAPHAAHRRASPRCAVLLHQRPLLALTTNLCLDARPANEGGLRHGSRGCTERHRRLRRPHVLRLPSLRLLAAASTTRRRFDYTYSPPRFDYTYSPPLRLLSAASAALPAHRYCCRLLHRRCFAARRRLLLLRLLPSAVRALLLPLAAASRFAAARYFCCLLPSASHRRCFAARCRLPVLRSLPSAASPLLSCLPLLPILRPLPPAVLPLLLPPAGLPLLPLAAVCYTSPLLCFSLPAAGSALAAVCCFAARRRLPLLRSLPSVLYGRCLCCSLLHRRFFAARRRLLLLRSFAAVCCMAAAVCCIAAALLLTFLCRFCARCRLLIAAACRRFRCLLQSASHRRCFAARCGLLNGPCFCCLPPLAASAVHCRLLHIAAAPAACRHTSTLLLLRHEKALFSVFRRHRGMGCLSDGART